MVFQILLILIDDKIHYWRMENMMPVKRGYGILGQDWYESNNIRRTDLNLPDDLCSNLDRDIEIYNTVYWSKLQSFVLKRLQTQATCPNLYSFEDLYSCVYNCMQSNYTEKLHRDLVGLVTSHVHQLSSELAVISQNIDSLEDKCHYIQRFHTTLKVYGQSLQKIVPVFQYLNHTYVHCTGESTLENQFLQLFKDIIVSSQAQRVIDVMKDVRNIPFAIDPSIMSELADALYKMTTDLRNTEADFFALYIPSVRLAPSLNDLEKDIEDTKLLQHHLQNQSTFRRSNCGKRSCEVVQREDQECSSSLLSSMLNGSGT